MNKKILKDLRDYDSLLFSFSADVRENQNKLNYYLFYEEIGKVQAQYFMLPDEYLRPSKKQNYDPCLKTNVVDKLSSHRRRSVKKTFLKISQISQENTCVEASFNKAVGL